MNLFDEDGPEDMVREADVRGHFRFSLKRTWQPGKPRAAWLMCNPSTADALEDDPTIRRVVKFSKAAGCGSATVVNVWPLRTPYPVDLWPQLATLPESAVRLNIDAIDQAAKVGPGGVRFVAFGAEPPKRDLAATIQAIRSFALRQGPGGSPVVALGVNEAGWPLHPLARGKFAIRKETVPAPWSWPAGLVPPGGRCGDCVAWSPWAAMTGDCMAWARRKLAALLDVDQDDRPVPAISAACTWRDDSCPEFKVRADVAS